MRIREVLGRLKDDGWYLVRTRGSHRQFKHPTKSGLVTVTGQPGDELAPGTLNSILKAGRVEAMKVLIVVEQTGTGFSAYSPALPGCVATGNSRPEVEQRMREAVAFHLEGLRSEGQSPPESTSYATVIEVAA